MTDIEKAQLIIMAFPGRGDCYGAGGGTCVKKPLARVVVLGHILGEERIGRYLLCKDGTIGALAVDIDEEGIYKAVEFRTRCQRYLLTGHIERSKSKGYHVWWFFSHPVSARKARLVAGHILEECELLGRAEIFPKQDLLGPGRYGNYINLPEFGSDVRRGRTVFLDPGAGYGPYCDQWEFLASRTMIEESLLDEIIEVNALSRQPNIQVKEESKAEDSPESTGLPCFSRMIEEGVEEGMRNEAALRLSVGLFRTGIPEDLALVMLKEWNERNRPPLDHGELERAISNGYLGTYGHGCFSRLIQPYCDPDCPIFRKHNQKRGEEAQRKN
jgi:hypothetical protein